MQNCYAISISNVKNIVEYYDATLFDYIIGWNLKKHNAMHYGFWDTGARSLGKALEAENEFLAELVHIKSDDMVLDAGCGVGGSTIFLAKSRQCKVTGITLSEKQVILAQKYARNSSIANLIKFQKADFNKTSFGNATFDVVWAVESVCHNQEKEDFLKEAYRILKPGGRLVVADGFGKEGVLSAVGASNMNKWLSGWGVQSLDSPSQFESKLKHSGFKSITCTDKTYSIMRSARRIYLYSYIAIPMDIIMRTLKIRKPAGKLAALATKYQYKTLKHHLWSYCVFTAVK